MWSLLGWRSILRTNRRRRGRGWLLIMGGHALSHHEVNYVDKNWYNQIVRHWCGIRSLHYFFASRYFLLWNFCPSCTLIFEWDSFSPQWLMAVLCVSKQTKLLKGVVLIHQITFVTFVETVAKKQQRSTADFVKKKKCVTCISVLLIDQKWPQSQYKVLSKVT